MHPGAELREGRDHPGVGVTVAVVPPDADERDLGRHRGEEGRVGRGCPVVRDGEHRGVQPTTCPLEQLGLARTLHVPRQQHARVPPGEVEHQGGLVQLAAGRAEGPARRRVQDRDAQIPHHRGIATLGGLEGRPALRGECRHLGERPAGRPAPATRRLGGGAVRRCDAPAEGLRWGPPQGGDPDPLEHVWDPAEVVPVRVGDDHEVEVPPAVRA